MATLNAQAIINYIATAEKKTPVKVYLKGPHLDQVEFPANTDPFIETTQAGLLFSCSFSPNSPQLLPKMHF